MSKRIEELKKEIRETVDTLTKGILKQRLEERKLAEKEFLDIFNDTFLVKLKVHLHNTMLYDKEDKISLKYGKNVNPEIDIDELKWFIDEKLKQKITGGKEK